MVDGAHTCSGRFIIPNIAAVVVFDMMTMSSYQALLVVVVLVIFLTFSPSALFVVAVLPYLGGNVGIGGGGVGDVCFGLN